MPPKKNKFAPFTVGSMQSLVSPLPPKIKTLPTAVPLPGTCPQGKLMFTKAHAQAAALRIGSVGHNTSNVRRPMKVYRCTYCSHYHIGHQR